MDIPADDLLGAAVIDEGGGRVLVRVLTEREVFSADHDVGPGAVTGTAGDPSQPARVLLDLLVAVDRVMGRRTVPVVDGARHLAHQIGDELGVPPVALVLQPPDPADPAAAADPWPPRFPVQTAHGAITSNGVPATLSTSAWYASAWLTLRWMHDDFGQLYPRSLWQPAGITAIVLAPSLAFAGQPRKAIPDLEHGTLFVDVDVRGMI